MLLDAEYDSQEFSPQAWDTRTDRSSSFSAVDIVKTGATTLEIGVRRTNVVPGEGVRIYSLAADITYTPLVTPTPTPTPPPTPPPSAATPVPTMSAYGIGLTMLGLLLVAGRRLRASAKRNK